MTVRLLSDTLNLWGPMYQMANAASNQALEECKKRLREFLEESNAAGRQAMVVGGGGRDGGGGDDVQMRKLNGYGKAVVKEEESEDED